MPILNLLPANAVSASAEIGSKVSATRRASDIAQLILPFLQVAGGTIPLAGPPLQAATGGLLLILQDIDVRASLIEKMLLIPRIIIEEYAE
jgi:hypothetical protein